MDLKVKKSQKPLQGAIRPESDKSISQRLILFSLLTEEECVFEKISSALDPRSALSAAACLGLEYRLENDTLFAKGPGIAGLKEPDRPIYCGNSGTLMRLLMGLLAPSRIFAVLYGDHSLNNRPMARIAEPLRDMGAVIHTRRGGLAPIAVVGGDLKGTDFTLPVASAQLKSAVILASLHSEGQSRLIEPIPSRDHTEMILAHMGAEITRQGSEIIIEPGRKLSGIKMKVGGDFSSAAFFIGAGLLGEGSEIILDDVNLNPTRTGLLKVLERMGASLVVDETEDVEPIGRIKVASENLCGTVVESVEVPLLIDEIPLLAVLAAAAEGTTTICGVSELKVKESDRLSGIAELVRLLGRECAIKGEGKNLTLEIYGRPDEFEGGTYDPKFDHRLAMAACVAGLNSPEGITVLNAECAEVSQPQFYSELKRLGAQIEE